MPEKYTREQLWKLYNNLPKDLKETIFSEQTADNIWNVCQQNEITEDLVPEIAERVGYVLLGLLAPDDFQTALEKEVGLKKEAAKKVFREINRFVFFPVKWSLASFYETKTFGKKATETVEPEEKPEEISEKPGTKDLYRESIE